MKFNRDFRYFVGSLFAFGFDITDIVCYNRY